MKKFLYMGWRKSHKEVILPKRAPKRLLKGIINLGLKTGMWKLICEEEA